MIVQTIIQSPPGTINQANVAQVVAVLLIGIGCYIATIQVIKSHFDRSKSMMFLASILYGGLILKTCMILLPALYL